MPNVQIKDLSRVAKGMDDRIDKSILLWLGPIKRIENYRIPERGVCGGKCMGRGGLIL